MLCFGRYPQGVELSAISFLHVTLSAVERSFHRAKKDEVYPERSRRAVVAEVVTEFIEVLSKHNP